MDSDSDTEYEIDNDPILDDGRQPSQAMSEIESVTTAEEAPLNSSLLDTLRRQGRKATVTEETLKEAIKTLERVSREGINGEDEEAHTFDSAAILCHTLEHGVGEMHFWDVRERLFTAQLVHTLFKLRAQCRPPSREEHIVTFADALLVLLFPASPPGKVDATAGYPEWENMKERDMLFAATCLPDRVHELPQCIRDQSKSPATRRLALTILWGCGVFWEDGKRLDSLELEAAVEAYVGKSCSEETLSTRNCLAYAYALALFAKVADPTAFRPATHSKILAILLFLIDQPESQEDAQSEKMDAVDLLVRYGAFVQWAWRAWPCSEQNEGVLCGLTALWLHYHHGKRGCGGDWPALFGEHAAAALPVLRTMLRRASPTATALLVPLLAALVHCHVHVEDPAAIEDIFLAASTLLISDCEPEVKEGVVRLWSSRLATRSLMLLEGAKVMELIGDGASLVAKSIAELSGETEKESLSANKPVLDFICLAAQSSTISKLLASHPSLLPTLSQWVCGFERGPALEENYRAAVVLLFGLITKHIKKKTLPYDLEALHDIVLDRSPLHVLGAGTYAQYSMRLVEKSPSTQLMRMEVWDYFVDALHLSPDDPEVFPYRDLLEVSFSLYCAALSAALGSLEPGPVQFILASERTISLVSRLKAAAKLEEDGSGLSSINKTAAKHLLDQIKAALSGSSFDDPFPVRFRVTYSECKGSMHAITIPIPPTL